MIAEWRQQTTGATGKVNADSTMINLFNQSFHVL
jgi:hypothetical protein